MLLGFPDYGLASIRVGLLRKLVRVNGDPCPQGVMLAPTDAEPWHAVVFDLAHPDRCRGDATCKAIARAAEWCVPLVRALE